MFYDFKIWNINPFLQYTETVFYGIATALAGCACTSTSFPLKQLQAVDDISNLFSNCSTDNDCFKFFII